MLTAKIKFLKKIKKTIKKKRSTVFAFSSSTKNHINSLLYFPNILSAFLFAYLDLFILMKRNHILFFHLFLLVGGKMESYRLIFFPTFYHVSNIHQQHHLFPQPQIMVLFILIVKACFTKEISL